MDKTLNEMLEELGNLSEVTTSEETARGHDEMFAQLKDVEGFTDWLRNVMSNDVKRSFLAQPLEQAIIRGAFARTKLILGLLQKADKPSTPAKPKRSLKGKRYA